MIEAYGLFKDANTYCLALEYMAGGELYEDILRRSCFTEACARRVSSVSRSQCSRPRGHASSCAYRVALCRAWLLTVALLRLGLQLQSKTRSAGACWLVPPREIACSSTLTPQSSCPLRKLTHRVRYCCDGKISFRLKRARD